MTTITAHKTEEMAKAEYYLSGDVSLSVSFEQFVFGGSGSWVQVVDNLSGLDSSGGYYEVQQDGDYYINVNVNYQTLNGLPVLEFEKYDSSDNLLFTYRADRTDTQATSGSYIFYNCVVGDRLKAITYTNGSPNTIEGDLGAQLRRTVFQVRQLPSIHTF